VRGVPGVARNAGERRVARLFQPNSVVAVLPMITAPAARNAATVGASAGAGPGSVSLLPRLVGRPSISIRSFTVTGTPSSAPVGEFFLPALRAGARRFQRLRFITTKALISGFCRAMRSVTACSASSGVKDFAA